jgi:hypothetical protein
MLSRLRSEDGATAMLVAASLVLILGIAALAVDLTGAGFNQRRQAQIAADTAALAGAIEFNDVAAARDAALDVARRNLTIAYGNPADPDDPLWVELWRGCTDTLPAGFTAVDAPSTWTGFAGGKLQCISYSAEEIRVRIPDQVNATSFGPAIGANSVSTNAVAQATFRFEEGGTVFPFGMVATASTGGEVCMSSGPSGVAVGPCDGSDSGSFGTILPRQWAKYDVGTTVFCGSPGETQMATAMRVGFDHTLVSILPASKSGVLSGGSHPGDADILSTAGGVVKTDACIVDGTTGEALAADPTPVNRPPNTVEVDTGFPHAALFDGLVSDSLFPGSTAARLQQGTNPKRTIARKLSGTVEEFELDNTPLWEYLRDLGDLPAAIQSECDKAVIPSAPDPGFAMSACLKAANAAGATHIFVDSLADSPRFGWAPQFIYDDWGSGKKWQPISTFQPVFLNGLWFNCNGNENSPDNTQTCDPDGSGKGFAFLPGYGKTPLCDGKYPSGCKNARLDQVSAFFMPHQLLPKTAQNTFPGTVRGPYDVQLSK